MAFRIAQIDHLGMNARTSGLIGLGRLQAVLLAVAILVTASTAVGCSGQEQTPTGTSHATMSPQGGAMAAVWAERPAYTHTTPATEEAYHYALEHPLVLQWIPCYCGCGEMGHGSNLDCYFEPQGQGSLRFEEHASYCQICVDITLRTKQMAAAGATLVAIRGAIDAEFGTAGPGTDTAYPL